jgi:hypothetical protein
MLDPARRACRRPAAWPLSLVHIDGHSDFRRPGNYDSAAMLGVVAGMDLATGRGEALLTDWPDAPAPLVTDEQVVQIGEREGRDADFDSTLWRRRHAARSSTSSDRVPGLRAASSKKTRHCRCFCSSTANGEESASDRLIGIAVPRRANVAAIAKQVGQRGIGATL